MIIKDIKTYTDETFIIKNEEGNIVSLSIKKGVVTVSVNDIQSYKFVPKRSDQFISVIHMVDGKEVSVVDYGSRDRTCMALGWNTEIRVKEGYDTLQVLIIS